MLTTFQYINKTINGRIPFIFVGHIHRWDDVSAALEDSDIAAIGSAILIDPNWAGKYYVMKIVQLIIQSQLSNR